MPVGIAIHRSALEWLLLLQASAQPSPTLLRDMIFAFFLPLIKIFAVRAPVGDREGDKEEEEDEDDDEEMEEEEKKEEEEEEK